MAPCISYLLRHAQRIVEADGGCDRVFFATDFADLEQTWQGLKEERNDVRGAHCFCPMCPRSTSNGGSDSSWPISQAELGRQSSNSESIQIEGPERPHEHKDPTQTTFSGIPLVLSFRVRM